MKTLVLSILLLPFFAQAVPQKFTKCAKDIELKHPKRSSGVLFNEDCSVAYVLPPNQGTFTVLGLQPTGELDLVCSQYKDIEEAMKSTTSSLKRQTRRIERANKRIDELEAYLDGGLVPVGMSVDEVEDQIDELLEKSEEYQQKYEASWNRLKNMKSYYAQVQGARGGFAMESNFVDLVEEYQQKNPYLFFEPMKIEQSYLAINEKARAEGDPLSLPYEAVISLETAGFGNLPLLKNLRAPKPDGEGHQEEAPGDIFINGSQGNIHFSALGACPLLKNGQLPQDFTFAEFSGDISAKVIYQYHAQVKKGHTISYNLGQLASRIQKSTKRGGFFSTKTANSLTESGKSDSWFKFETYSNDPTVVYTEEYKKEIKQQFMDELLREIAGIELTSTGYPSLIEPGSNGASATADALGKCPHLYCQVGMAAITILDSTFGKTTAVSEYIKNKNVWKTKTEEDAVMVPYFGDYIFK